MFVVLRSKSSPPPGEIASVDRLGSAQLTTNKTPPTAIRTEAAVHLSAGAGGLSINRIDLVTRATVPGIDAAKFAELAKTAKEGCPLSKALAAVDIHLDAALEG